MRRTALFLAIALASGSAVAAPLCGKRDAQTYWRKADLPRGAAEATGVVMAERGAAYQRGDVMQRGLPLYRFVRADRSGCRIRIRYEQGGFAHRWGAVSVALVQGVWISGG